MARILIIDDEEVIRRMMRIALEQDGHQVVEASNGTEALQVQQVTPAELVITDMLMPEKDGVEVILALRRGAPQLKVIAMSGGGRFRQTEILDIAQPLGAVASMRKPFTPDTLLQTVKQALAA